jgi:UDP-glucose 4-epimerase
MTILITGGAGYIGSHMAYCLADVGQEAVVLDNLATGFDWAVPKGTPLVVGDCGDQNLVLSLITDHNVEAIIHFAASTIVPESVAVPLNYYRNNTDNSRALIECAIKGGVRHFIFSSTAAVYGNPTNVPIAEDSPTLPLSPYGWSKLMAELMLRDAGTAHGLNYLILRYFNVAGADPQLRTGQSTGQATHLVKVAVQAALGLRSKIEIFGTNYPTPDGTCVRDYVHVSDLVNAHASALGYLRRGGNSMILNCGYGRGFSVLEVIDAVKRTTGAAFTTERRARRPGDPTQIIAAADQIKAVLGWRPQFEDLSTIVRHAFDWERNLARK